MLRALLITCAALALLAACERTPPPTDTGETAAPQAVQAQPAPLPVHAYQLAPVDLEVIALQARADTTALRSVRLLWRTSLQPRSTVWHC